MISTKILDISDTFQNNSGNKHFTAKSTKINDKMIINNTSLYIRVIYNLIQKF